MDPEPNPRMEQNTDATSSPDVYKQQSLFLTQQKFDLFLMTMITSPAHKMLCAADEVRIDLKGNVSLKKKKKGSYDSDHNPWGAL